MGHVAVSDLDKVLQLWRQIADGVEECVLATVVRVEGSSYRKPGARMLMTKSGLRAGTISGGCLEAEVSKQAWWLTEKGPLVKAYSTSFETDGDRPYGLGCGGTVHLLLERRESAEGFLRRLKAAWEARLPLACAVALSGPETGRRSLVDEDTEAGEDVLGALAMDAFRSGVSSFLAPDGVGEGVAVFAEYLAPRCGLMVFGAGDDAKPLVALARTMGWHITAADGRSNLATRTRFPEADEVIVLTSADEARARLRSTDAAVLMTHSYEQDLKYLRMLLTTPLAYLAVLGPRYRTADLLQDAAARKDVGAEESRMKVHSPAGLNLGGDGPAVIALSIVAEIQATISKAVEHTGRSAPSRVESNSREARAVASLSTVLT